MCCTAMACNSIGLRGLGRARRDSRCANLQELGSWAAHTLPRVEWMWLHPDARIQEHQAGPTTPAHLTSAPLPVSHTPPAVLCCAQFPELGGLPSPSGRGGRGRPPQQSPRRGNGGGMPGPSGPMGGGGMGGPGGSMFHPGMPPYGGHVPPGMVAAGHMAPFMVPPGMMLAGPMPGARAAGELGSVGDRGGAGEFGQGGCRHRRAAGRLGFGVNLAGLQAVYTAAGSMSGSPEADPMLHVGRGWH